MNRLGGDTLRRRRQRCRSSNRHRPCPHDRHGHGNRFGHPYSGALSSGSQPLALTAGNAITLGGATTTASASLVAGGNIITQGILSANSGDISFSAGNDITAAGLSASGGGDIRLTAGGLLNVQAGAAWTGRDLYLTADDFGGGSLASATLQETRNLVVTDTLGGLSISSATNLVAANNLTVQTVNGDLSIGGISAGGSITLQSSGGLTISDTIAAVGDPVTATALNGNLTFSNSGRITGSDVILFTNAAFLNDRGADAITASGRWLVYSAAPASNVFGGLDSGKTAIWNGTLATRAPGTISGTRYVFALQPTLTFTSSNLNKTYGTTLTNSGFSVTGYQAGVAGAFVGDTAATAFTGAPVLSSVGYAERASVAGGPYAITVAAGSLGSLSGYAFAFNSAGLLAVDQKAISGNVVVNNKTYDGNTSATGSVTLSGVVAGDSVSGSASYAFADKNAALGKTVGVTGGALSGSDAGNYTLTLPASVLADILRQSLAIAAENKSKDEGDADPVLTYQVTAGSLVAGDSLTGSLARATGEGPGSYAITQGGLTAGQNYNISFQNGVLTIAADPRPSISLQPLRALALPAQIRKLANHRSPIKIHGDIFCVREPTCQLNEK